MIDKTIKHREWLWIRHRTRLVRARVRIRIIVMVREMVRITVRVMVRVVRRSLRLRTSIGFASRSTASLTALETINYSCLCSEA